MRQAESQTLRNLHRFVTFFVGFLGVLATALAARYPVPPEYMIAVYRVDAVAAARLSTALTVIVFVACITLVGFAKRTSVVRAKNRNFTFAGLMAYLGLFGLLLCGLGLAINPIFVKASTHIADAIAAAEHRQNFDEFARDTVLTLRDNSLSLKRRCELATIFFHSEQIVERPSEESLQTIRDAPLQGFIFVDYVGVICCFKIGIFMLVVALYLWSKDTTRLPRRSSRVPHKIVA